VNERSYVHRASLPEVRRHDTLCEKFEMQGMCVALLDEKTPPQIQTQSTKLRRVCCGSRSAQKSLCGPLGHVHRPSVRTMRRHRAVHGQPYVQALQGFRFFGVAKGEPGKIECSNARAATSRTNEKGRIATNDRPLWEHRQTGQNNVILQNPNTDSNVNPEFSPPKDGRGRYKSSLAAVTWALERQTKYRLKFHGGWVFIAVEGGDFRPLTDNDYINMRTAFEREFNFAPVGKFCMRDAVKQVTRP
jgi:hypothetical protein